MNIFYASPEQIWADRIELTGQEAKHASKVLRYREGDAITIVDGQGGWYEGKIGRILRDTIQIRVDNKTFNEPPEPRIVMAMGIIKKRDRLEFAVEKAVELGVSELILFRSEHTIKENVRMDRLESTILSAMKQSLRAYLPSISVHGSLQKVVENYKDTQILVAHEKQEGEPGIPVKFRNTNNLLLLVGPEGGFAENEISLLMEYNAKIISLGSNRLRTETAVAAFLSQFL